MWHAISLKKQVLWAKCRQACKTTLTMKPTGVTLKSAAVLLSRTTAYLKSLAKNLADHNPTGDVLTDSLFFGAASMLPHTLLETPQGYTLMSLKTGQKIMKGLIT